MCGRLVAKFVRTPAGDAAGPAMRLPSLWKPSRDERLVEARQLVGPGTERIGVNTYPYLATYCVPC